MAVSKSGARMDYWREYFRSANADIFEIIEGAIMTAASDFPKEFRIRRDGIAQILFSCKLIKCSGCDKEELAVPVDDEHHDDDDDGIGGNGGGDGEEVKYKSKLADIDGDWIKGKVVNSSTNDDDDDDDVDGDEENDDDHHHHDVEVNKINHHVSKYSYKEAEALNDAIEEESQMYGEVMRIKQICDNRDEPVSVVCNSLRKLQLMGITVETLKATDIGISVNLLRKHASRDVRQIANALVEMWKGMVDQWVVATTKIPVSNEATPDSMNPSGLEEDEEEEGLPSPPLDDLAFLNPHSISLELTEFFDGMDDYGNPRKNEESNKNHNNDGKSPVKKQNVPNWKQPKPSNGLTIGKPSKPPVANSSPGTQMKPNMDRKLQAPERPTLPKRPVPPQQRKPRPTDEETVQDKLEATKRKLQERYQQAENAKRQRTIQVMELHDLPKQGIAPKNQHMRAGNNHNRHWSHGRC